MNEIIDTLRYFYSAVFQGFAALITLGGMFYIFYKQYIEHKKEKYISEMNDQFERSSTITKDEIKFKGIINYVRELVNRTPHPKLKELLENYDNLDNKLKPIESKIPKVLKETIIILITSLISLFLIGYNGILNYILICMGIFIIVLSIINLNYIRNLIVKIIKP